MQIAGLKLTNFRSHLDTQFGFDRINVIRGLNGVGKTSIAMAIELALTGRCEVTDAAGKGADDLIHSSAKEAIIDLLIKADGWKHGPLTRRQLRSGQTTTIGAHTGRSAMAVIEAQLARIPVLSAVLNSHRFLEMDAKSQKALLADSLGSDPVDVDESILADADRVSPNTVCKSIASAAEVDRIYDIFFKMRTLEKRELAGLGAIAEPDIPEDAPSLKETREKLGRLRTDKDVLIQERGKKQREYQKASDEYFHAVQKLREVEAEVLESDELNRLELIVKSRPKVVKLEEEINALRGKISSTRESITRLNSPQASSCPTCGHALEVKDNSAVVKQLEADT
jgi:DNA repair exonuclease SbcCD ATPase subunit